MKKYMIGLLIFIGCAQILCADDDSGLFDYVSSRDEVAVLSMIKEDYDAFTNLGLHVNAIDNNVIDEQGQICTIKVARENGCAIAAIFYTYYFKNDLACWKICFLVVDESCRNEGYGPYMIRSLIMDMIESNGVDISILASIANLSYCSGLEDDFNLFRLFSHLSCLHLEDDTFYTPQRIFYIDSDITFYQACRDLDIEKIKECIAAGAHINQLFLFKDIPDHDFVIAWDLKTPLYFAVESGNC